MKKLIAIFLTTSMLFAISIAPSFGLEYNHIFKKTQDAKQYFKSEILHRSDPIDFYLLSSNDQLNIKKVFDKSLFYEKATDFSNRGDYIRYSIFNGYQLSYTIKCHLGKYKYHFTFQPSYKTSLQQEKDFEKKLKEVITSLKLNNKSDFEKISAIYNYVCKNVKYDHTNGSNYPVKYTAYGALNNKSAVCQGYASLIYAMCKEAKIPVRIITGKSKGQLHAWNIVKIGSHYYNLDATWDSINDDYQYFLKSNKGFKYHTRNTSFNTKSFNKTHKMSSKNYPC